MGAVFAVALCRAPTLDALPGCKVALVAGRGEPLHSLTATDELTATNQLTLLVGAEREGLPEERDRPRRAGRAHPDRDRVAERRDGRDDRALRAD